MNKEEAIRILRGDVLGTNEQTHEAVFMAIKALKAEPKRGKWIVQDTSYWRATHAEDVQVNRLNLKCSLCGWRNHERKDYNYCPNCGAKMERSEE